MVLDFIKEVCDLLEIDIPEISYESSHFLTETMLAICEPALNIIYLRRPKEINPDFLFVIAHELRHIYQYQTDEYFYLSSYVPSNECSSIEEYNLQIAEVDANAFAAVVMIAMFSIQPKWNNLTDRVIAAINDRKKIIIQELEWD